MGVVLDSTVLVGAQRRRQTVSEVIEQVRDTLHDPEIAIAAMTAAELVHGVWRAKAAEIRIRREEFVEEVFARIPVRAMSLRTARLAGRIDAECRSKGITLPTPDLLIGATALELGFGVATANQRHYKLIPRLKVSFLT